jgi:F0F1-type ATP synthase epsilon subunit
MSNADVPTMHVTVQSPQKVYFDAAAISMSGEDATGPFDILPKHHNFIALLDACELVVRPPGQTSGQRIKISGGLMHVKADKVIVFLDA